MTRAGRPLWFLAAVIGGWTAARTAILWPDTAVPPRAAARGHWTPPRIAAAPPPSVALARSPVVTTLHPTVQSAHDPFARASPVAAVPSRVPTFVPVAAPSGEAAFVPPSPVEIVASPKPQRSAPPSRLGGGSWLIARGGSGNSLGFGELGGSQAGVRLTYALDRRRRVALSGRVSAPLRGGDGEAALGIDWRPTRLPVHLLAENRIDRRGAMRPTGEAIVGVYLRLPLGLTADGYAQAGGVARRGAFVDAAVRLDRSVAQVGAAHLALGGGVWGGAQRGVSRLDVGPSLGLAAPARPGTVRFSLDWRVRLAGRASPGSGPALTLGTGF